MRYWTYMNGEVPGSFSPEELAALPRFSMTTLVCPASGEIAEKNWRRAGEFSDIADAVNRFEAGKPPLAPPQPPNASASEVDALLDTASTRLFSHVADLMKELESRRDEKSLIVSLQRQIAALKQELAASREQATMMEIRLPRIAELEESLRKDHALLAQLQATLTAREQQANELRASYERAKAELDAAKLKLNEANNDLAIRNRLVDKLSHDLSEKELSLAKSLGVIRRLEEDLNKLCPSPELMSKPVAAPVPAPAPPKPEPVDAAAPVLESLPMEPTPLTPSFADEPSKVLTVPAAPEPSSEPAPAPAVYTSDEPPPMPPYLEPPVTESPKAHQALMGFLRKVFPGQSH